MTDAELVLRFFTLREKWRNFSGDYRVEMDRYMLEHRNLKKSQLSSLEAAFNTAIDTCQRVWGDVAFKRPTGDGWRDQLLTGMYDAQMVAVDQLTAAQRNRAIERADDVLQRTQELFRDGAFEQAVRVGTNTPSRVVYRIEQVVQILR